MPYAEFERGIQVYNSQKEQYRSRYSTRYSDLGNSTTQRILDELFDAEKLPAPGVAGWPRWSSTNYDVLDQNAEQQLAVVQRRDASAGRRWTSVSKTYYLLARDASGAATATVARCNAASARISIVMKRLIE